MCLYDVATMMYWFICRTVGHHANSGFFVISVELFYIINYDNDIIKSKHPCTGHSRVRGTRELLETLDLLRHYNTLLCTSLEYFT